MASDVSTGGRWNESEAVFPINYLERLAIFHALQSFCSDMRNVHVSIQSDSTNAIAYVNNMGGIASLSMDQLAQELWHWCLKRDIFISASFIPGVSNIRANFSSRNFSDSTEWMLKKGSFFKDFVISLFTLMLIFLHQGIIIRLKDSCPGFHNQGHGTMMHFLFLGNASSRTFLLLFL